VQLTTLHPSGPGIAPPDRQSQQRSKV
jgi:hypothetical protein